MGGFYERIGRRRPRRGRLPRRWVFLPYDQLRPDHPLLEGPPRETGLVYVETAAKPARRSYHKQKLVLLLSAMRHDALGRAKQGHPVLYHFSEKWYDGALEEVRAERGLESIEALAPAEAEVREALDELPWVTLRPNSLFITDAEFYRSVFPRPGRRRLERFYRAARKETRLLMDGDGPAGGEWNLDKENRKTWRGDPPVPARPSFRTDAITREVLALVEERYPRSFGTAAGFDWPVTSAEASRASDHFFDEVLPHFGPFEDAMADDEPLLFHSLLSASINLGHLDPLELCRRAETRYRKKEAPLASVEGFVRQILGWREFVRHVYEEHREEYARANALGADLPLPGWYWGERSGMRCLDRTVEHVRATGHSHHITRLMVLSNLATLLGIDPQALNRWFWIGYVDAYEWVVTPNVVGMGTFGDGGMFATKPYISSGKYIQRMGPTLCAACRYDPKRSDGDEACPFNHLYWDFLARNRARFQKNPRMAIPLASLRRLSKATLDDHRRHARAWRAKAKAAAEPSADGPRPKDV
jgi:deoxyribodipyrimidine photolyase-related protein